MISKRKRNTILAYCMASVVMLCALASNVSKVTTSLKTNSKKIVADNQTVETTELSYGLIALEASSCIEENKDAQNVTEEKKEDKKEEAVKKADSDKKKSTTTKNKTSKKSTATKKITTKKKSTSKTTTKKTTTTKKNTATKKTTTTKKNTTTNNTTNVETTTSTTNSSKGTAIVNYAKKFVGKRYVLGGQWNGEMPYKATDCSGFTQGVFRHFGISLPRVARDQAKVGKNVSWNALQPGDLLFYSGNGGKSVTHVAIYIGNGKIIHAQTPSLGIGITTSNIMVKMAARRVI